MLNNRSNPIDNPHRKKKLKSKKTSTSDRAISKRPSSSSGWASFFFYFLLKVFTCYLTLSYFYWCPQDPTQNPFVCRNLAQLHWALEPHLSPYLTQFNHHVRTPLQRRVDRKLRPFYDDYLLPSWTQLSPQALKALDLLKHSIHNSRTIERASHIQSLYLTPVVQHFKQRYQEKLEPHVRLTTNSTKHAYQVIRKSRFIQAVKSYLPRVKRFLVESTIQPIRDQVLPYLNKLHSQYVQPAILQLGESLYQYLFIHDNFLKHSFRSIKLAYRRRLLNLVKNLHGIYVRPQIKKIILKLEEYQNRNNDSIRVDRLTSPLTHQTTQDATLNEPLSKDRIEKSPPPIDQPSSPSSVADHLTREDPQESVIAAPDSLSDSSPKPVAMVLDRLANPSQKSHAENYTSASSDNLDDPPSASTIQREKEQSPAELKLDLLPDPAIDEELMDSEEDLEAEETIETDLDLDEHDDALDEDKSDDSLDTADTLTVDADEFMDEIKNEIASESEKANQVTDDNRTSRKQPEKIAEERKRLEKLAADGFKRLAELKKETIENFIKAVTSKRDEENLRQHEEFITKDRLIKIEQESEKLINRLEKWFQRNEKTETRKIKEKLSEAELVVKKSKEKFVEKLVHPHLVEIETYRQKQYQKELDIANESAGPAFEYVSVIESELGFGFTWLSDVTYHDWAIYHKFRAESDSIKKKMEDIIINGISKDDGSYEIPKAEFFTSIDRLKSAIDSTYLRFGKKLDDLYSHHLSNLKQLHQRSVTVDHPHHDF